MNTLIHRVTFFIAISFRQNMPHSSTIGDFVGPSGLGTSSSTSTTPKPVPSKPISQANRLTESCSVGNIIDITNSDEPALSTPTNAAEDRQRVADDILNKYRAIATMSETTQSAFQVQQMPLNHVPELSQVFREVGILRGTSFLVIQDEIGTKGVKEPGWQ
jgi:hypothetical protein